MKSHLIIFEEITIKSARKGYSDIITVIRKTVWWHDESKN